MPFAISDLPAPGFAWQQVMSVIAMEQARVCPVVLTGTNFRLWGRSSVPKAACFHVPLFQTGGLIFLPQTLGFRLLIGRRWGALCTQRLKAVFTPLPPEL